jgi:hypothetical protein
MAGSRQWFAAILHEAAVRESGIENRELPKKA